MFHTLAFRTTSFGTTANTKVNAVTDDQITIRNNNFFLPDVGKLLYAYSGSGDCVRSRLVTPTYRVIAPIQIRSVSSAILPPSPPNLMNMVPNPITAPGEQELSVETTDGTGTTTAVSLVGVEFGFSPAPSGDIYQIRAVGTTTVTAGAWTNCALTYDEDLPPGRYSVVGMSAVGTTCVGARLLFSGAFYRPGCLGNAANDGLTHEIFSNGKLGQWGTYENTVPPQVEFFCNAADTAQTIYLQIIRTSTN